MFDHARPHYNTGELRVKATLTQKTYFRLREKLTHGELPAGAQLVNRTLAKEFGSSLSPVREAINRLAEEGLVTQVAGAGAFVREISRRDLEEAYIVREAVEGCAAAEAALNIGPREVEHLDEVCAHWLALVRAIRRQPDKMATVEQRTRWADLDSEFHAILVAASNNRLLEKIVSENRLLSTVFKATRNVPEVTSLSAAAWTWRDHALLVRAMRRRDPDWARELMVHQIRKGRRLVLEFLRQKDQ
jgi:DNA-binding GntR family transcriptional regulator